MFIIEASVKNTSIKAMKLTARKAVQDAASTVRVLTSLEDASPCATAVSIFINAVILLFLVISVAVTIYCQVKKQDGDTLVDSR